MFSVGYLTHSKLQLKFLDPYEVTKTKPNEQYEVRRVGPGEPTETS